MATIGEKLAAALSGELIVTENLAEATMKAPESVMATSLVDQQLLEASLLQRVYDALLSSSQSIDYPGQGLRPDVESVFKAYSHFPHEIVSHQALRAFAGHSGIEKVLPTVELDLVWTRVMGGEMKRFGLAPPGKKGLDFEHFAWALALTLIEMRKRQRGRAGASTARPASEDKNEDAIVTELVDMAHQVLNAKGTKHYVEPTADPAPLLTESGLEAMQRAASLIQSLFVHYSEGMTDNVALRDTTLTSPLLSSPDQRRKLERRTSRSSFSVLGAGGGGASPTASQAGRMSVLGSGAAGLAVSTFGGAAGALAPPHTVRSSVTWTYQSSVLTRVTSQQQQAQQRQGSVVTTATAIGVPLEQRLVSFEGFCRFVAEFGLVPALITKRQLHSIFAATAVKPTSASEPTFREEDETDGEEREEGAVGSKPEDKFLTYSAFLEAFGRIALTAFGPQTAFGDAYPSAGLKMDALCDRILANREKLDAIVVKQKKESFSNAARKSGMLPASPIPAYSSGVSVAGGAQASPVLPTPPALSSARGRASVANLALVSGALGSAFSPGGNESFPVAGAQTRVSLGAPQVPGLDLTGVSPGAPPPLAGQQPHAATAGSGDNAGPATQSTPNKAPPPPPPRYSFRADGPGSGRGDASGQPLGRGSPPRVPPVLGCKADSAAAAHFLPLPSTPTGGSTTQRSVASDMLDKDESGETIVPYEVDIYGHSSKDKRGSGKSGRSTDSSGRGSGPDSERLGLSRRQRRRSSGDLPLMPLSGRTTPADEHLEITAPVAPTAAVPAVVSPAPPPLPPAHVTGAQQPAPQAPSPAPQPPQPSVAFGPSPRTFRATSSRARTTPSLETLPEGDEETQRRASLTGGNNAAATTQATAQPSSAVGSQPQWSPTGGAAIASRTMSAPVRRSSSIGGTVLVDDSTSSYSYSLMDSASATLMAARAGRASIAGSTMGGQAGGGAKVVRLGHRDFGMAGSLAASQMAAASGVILSPQTVAGSAGISGAERARRASSAGTSTVRRMTMDGAAPIPIPIKNLQEAAAASDAKDKGLAFTPMPTVGESAEGGGRRGTRLSKEAAVGYRVDPAVVDRLCEELSPAYLPRLLPLFSYYSKIRDPANRGDRCSVVNFFRLLRDVGDVFDNEINVGDVQLQVSLVLNRGLLARREATAGSRARSASATTSFARASAGGANSRRQSFSRSMDLQQFFECLVRVSELIRRSVTLATARQSHVDDTARTPSAQEGSRRASSVPAQSSATDELLRHRRPSFGLRAFMSGGPSSSPPLMAVPHSDLQVEEKRKDEERERNHLAARSVCQAFFETRVMPLYSASAIEELTLMETGQTLLRSDPGIADAVSEHAPFLVRVFKHYATEILVMPQGTDASSLASPVPSPVNTSGASAVPRSAGAGATPILALFLPGFLEMVKDFGLAPGLLSFLEVEHLLLDTARRAGTGGSTASLAFAPMAPAPTEEAPKAKGLFAIDAAKEQARRGRGRSPAPSPQAAGTFQGQRRGGGRIFDEAAFASVVSGSPLSSPASSIHTGKQMPYNSASHDAIAARKFVFSGAFLNFLPFVEAWTALAMIGFSRPYLAHHCVTPADKIAAMCHWCYSAVVTMGNIRKAELASRAGCRRFNIGQLTGEASSVIAAILEKTGRLVRLLPTSAEADAFLGHVTPSASPVPEGAVRGTSTPGTKASRGRQAKTRESEDSMLDVSELSPLKMQALLKALATGDKRWFKASSTLYPPGSAASRTKEGEAKDIRVTLFTDAKAAATASGGPSSPLHPARASLSRSAEVSAFTEDAEHRASFSSTHKVTNARASTSALLLSPGGSSVGGRPTVATGAVREEDGLKDDSRRTSLLGLSTIADLPMSINELLAGLPSSASSADASFSTSSSSSAETRRTSAASVDGCVELCLLLGLEAPQAYIAAQHAATVCGLLAFPSAEKRRLAIGHGEKEDEDFLAALSAAVELTAEILKHNLPPKEQRPNHGQHRDSKPSGASEEEENANMLLLLADALIIQVLKGVPESVFRISSVAEEVRLATNNSIQQRGARRASELKRAQEAPARISDMARAAEVLAAGFSGTVSPQKKAQRRGSTSSSASDVSQQLEEYTQRMLRASTAGGYARTVPSAATFSPSLFHPHVFAPGEVTFLARQAKGREHRASLSPDKHTITRSASLTSASPKRGADARTSFNLPSSVVISSAHPQSPISRLARQSLRLDVASSVAGSGSDGGSEAQLRARRSPSPQGRYSPGRLTFQKPAKFFDESLAATKAKAPKPITEELPSQAPTTPYASLQRESLGFGNVAATEPRPLAASIVRDDKQPGSGGKATQAEIAVASGGEEEQAEEQQPQSGRAKRLSLVEFGLSNLTELQEHEEPSDSPTARIFRQRLTMQKEAASRLSLPSPRQTETDVFMVLRGRDGAAKFIDPRHAGASATHKEGGVTVLTRKALRSPTTAEAAEAFIATLRKGTSGSSKAAPAAILRATKRASPAASGRPASPRLSALLLAAGQKDGHRGFDIEGGGTPTKDFRQTAIGDQAVIPPPYSKAKGRAKDFILAGEQQDTASGGKSRGQTAQTPLPRSSPKAGKARGGDSGSGRSGERYAKLAATVLGGGGLAAGRGAYPQQELLFAADLLGSSHHSAAEASAIPRDRWML